MRKRIKNEMLDGNKYAYIEHRLQKQDQQSPNISIKWITMKAM